MAMIPETVKKAWDDRNGAVVLTTVDNAGIPNSIYVTCVKRIADDKIAIADNYFDKTRSNIKNGSSGSILFITGEDKSYQIKGSLEYHTSGAVFDEMKIWLDAKYPGIATTVLVVEKVYSGADELK